MARIIVVADSPAGPTLFEERVVVPLLQSPHASAQLLERIAWAVADAEAAEVELRQARSSTETSSAITA